MSNDEAKTASVGVFYGTDTGNTQRIAEMIVEQLGSTVAECKDIDLCDVEEFMKHDIILFGVSTWNFGEIQCSWDEKLDELAGSEFSEKYVGMFGLGDSVGYPDTFVDGLGILWESLGEERPKLIGKWPTEGYQFTESRGLVDDDHFFGLVIDEDSEPEHTDDRVERWVEQIKGEITKIIDGEVVA
ncbi:MAG: flavodoxin [Planctomycetota bacterium]